MDSQNQTDNLMSYNLRKVSNLTQNKFMNPFQQTLLPQSQLPQFQFQVPQQPQQPYHQPQFQLHQPIQQFPSIFQDPPTQVQTQQLQQQLLQQSRNSDNIRSVYSIMHNDALFFHPDKFEVAVISLPTATLSANGGWDNSPETQYHIQTDEGPERYFRYQTMSGQYRKEKRLEDGTVIGTYGWVDANGYLRMRDYIADNQGYRILKTKNVFVGKDRAIGQAVSAAKNAPAEAGVLVKAEKKPESKITPIYNRPAIAVYSTPSTPHYVEITPKITPIAVYSTPKSNIPFVQITHNSLPSSTERPAAVIPSSTIEPPTYAVTDKPSSVYLSSSTPLPSTGYLPSSTYSTTPSPIAPIASNDLDYAPESSFKRPQINYQSKYTNPYVYQNGPTYPIDRHGNTYNGYSNNQIGNGYDNQFPYYDGVAVTNDGFRYYLPKQYHEEQTLPGDQRTGSFGYVDPFGIRRVVYYNTAPGTGFQHRKNNRYVGFDATPYDPRPYR